MKKIEEFIHHLECPTINGIIFPDNTIQLLDIKINHKNVSDTSIKPGAKTSISDLYHAGKLWWNDCVTLVAAEDLNFSIKVVAGEAMGHGSDGFIGVIHLASNKLKWLAFFDCSNPFTKIQIANNKLFATSTINCTWEFDINNPSNCTIQCSE